MMVTIRVTVIAITMMIIAMTIIVRNDKNIDSNIGTGHASYAEYEDL
jgi:hypothetical protein